MRPTFADWWNRIRSRVKQGKPVALGGGKPMRMPSDEALITHHDREWSRLQADVKRHAKAMLLALPEWQTVADFVRARHAEFGGMWMHAGSVEWEVGGKKVQIPTGGHFGWGMAIRNYLRTGKIHEYRPVPAVTGEPSHAPSARDHVVAFDSGYSGIKDDQLPSGNWDDYYIQALEYVAGLREL